jgi:hypothetical protein
MSWVSILSFIWTQVVPNVKDILRIVGCDTYGHIKDRVDDQDIINMSGLEKRAAVYASAMAWLKERNIDDIEIFGSAAIYFLIELAVINLRKKKRKG